MENIGINHLSNHVENFHLLRKAVRRTDSLLFATEGRIGGLGGERRFCGLNLAVPLGGGWSGGAVFRRMYPVAI